MFICHECGYHFDEPRIVCSMHNIPMCEAYPDEEMCPSCGSTDFDEGEDCYICGGSAEKTLYGVCEECAREITKKALGILRSELSDDEYTAFVELFEVDDAIEF